MTIGTRPDIVADCGGEGWLALAGGGKAEKEEKEEEAKEDGEVVARRRFGSKNLFEAIDGIAVVEAVALALLSASAPPPRAPAAAAAASRGTSSKAPRRSVMIGKRGTGGERERDVSEKRGVSFSSFEENFNFDLNVLSTLTRFLKKIETLVYNSPPRCTSPFGVSVAFD